MTSTATTTVAILAAGQAQRFGGGKLDAICAGRRLGEWAILAVEAAGFSPGIVIVPPECPAFPRAHPQWRCVTNHAAKDGIGTSVALAAQTAQHDGAKGLLLMLADMPLLEPAHLRALPGPTAAATRQRDGKPGTPAFFPASLLKALAMMDPAHGAASMLLKQPDLRCYSPASTSLADVDYPMDLKKVAAELL
ncbi:nucleotidyltransferase family protein [Altericroceibacterium endophyticum]|uniref:NTP transferase domain-containing protein n=1 Tax=Altericroceibacterium endophyticum TaxID=1808508 RepID=A0A6I4T4Q7_9SPHN|nr:NTP transferase domain-containing protein [Altericroceibacterium endophyticum]MXO65131.1 NTP transferase domain-containing protein [Altericroceibacterium endophyticum]